MNKDVESLILMKLDDEDLERLGETISKRVYQDDMFWKRRTIMHYPEIVKYKEKYSKSWKEYYDSLKTFINYIYDDDIQDSFGREDLIYLNKRFGKTSDEVLTSINRKNEDWKTIITRNDCNPNVFDHLFYTFRDDKTSEKYVINSLRYLINLKDKRIRISLLLFEFLFLRSDKMRELIELSLKDSRVNIGTIENVLARVNFKKTNSKILDIYLDFIEKKLSAIENKIFLRKFIVQMQE